MTSLRLPALALLAALGAGCQAPTPAEPAASAGRAGPSPTSSAPATSPADADLVALAGLGSDDGGPRPRYDRAAFGPAWADVDGNHCSTRQDVLRAQLRDVVTRPGGCVVVTGTLLDPYTGQTVRFTSSQPEAVQVDHVVAIANAWYRGAHAWPAATRLAFANDMRNLLATAGAVNEAKADKDAARWRPPLASAGCRYAQIVVRVKSAYRLAVSSAERRALGGLLATCAAP